MAILKIGNEALQVAVDSHGAELNSIRSADGAEWLWQGDPEFWNGRAPILFPVVGRSPDSTVTIGGRKFPMSNHGFARTTEFAAVEQRPETLRLRIVDSEETRKSYPFAFQLDIVFALEGATLVNRAEVRNTGSVRMPFSLGFHPAFFWPLPGGERKTHFVTLADTEEPPTLRLGDKLVLAPGEELTVFTEGRFAPSPADFERDAIIIDDIRSHRATFGVDGGPQVLVTWDGLTALGLWQKPGAAYLCIEPWQGLPPYVGGSVALEERPGIVWLDPGASRTFTMTITPHAPPGLGRPAECRPFEFAQCVQ
ncbi:MAG: aldose 1-epimerase family protein [Bauldia sp.]